MILDLDGKKPLWWTGSLIRLRNVAELDAWGCYYALFINTRIALSVPRIKQLVLTSLDLLFVLAFRFYHLIKKDISFTLYPVHSRVEF